MYKRPSENFWRSSEMGQRCCYPIQALPSLLALLAHFPTCPSTQPHGRSERRARLFTTVIKGISPIVGGYWGLEREFRKGRGGSVGIKAPGMGRRLGNSETGGRKNSARDHPVTLWPAGARRDRQICPSRRRSVRPT